jgi:hypothetical protein
MKAAVVVLAFAALFCLSYAQLPICDPAVRTNIN